VHKVDNNLWITCGLVWEKLFLMYRNGMVNH
jgi:hypothetical protein